MNNTLKLLFEKKCYFKCCVEYLYICKHEKTFYCIMVSTHK